MNPLLDSGGGTYIAGQVWNVVRVGTRFSGRGMTKCAPQMDFGEFTLLSSQTLGRNTCGRPRNNLQNPGVMA